MSRLAIPKRLRVLEAAGLIEAQQEGTSRLVRLEARPRRAVVDWDTTMSRTGATRSPIQGNAELTIDGHGPEAGG